MDSGLVIEDVLRQNTLNRIKLPHLNLTNMTNIKMSFIIENLQTSLIINVGRVQLRPLVFGLGILKLFCLSLKRLLQFFRRRNMIRNTSIVLN